MRPAQVTLAGHFRLPARPAVCLLLVIFFPFHFDGFSIFILFKIHLFNCFKLNWIKLNLQVESQTKSWSFRQSFSLLLPIAPLQSYSSLAATLLLQMTDCLTCIKYDWLTDCTCNKHLKERSGTSLDPVCHTFWVGSGDVAEVFFSQRALGLGKTTGSSCTQVQRQKVAKTPVIENYTMQCNAMHCIAMGKYCIFFSAVVPWHFISGTFQWGTIGPT